MQVAVIGAGYVGLTTAACLAELGHTACSVEIDRQKIEMLLRGRVPLHEDGLAEIVERNTAAGRLGFTTDLGSAVKGADTVVIAVGTPKGAAGEADLSQVTAAARQLATAIRPQTVVVIKSTVAVGTARLIREVIAEERGGLDFRVASNPEFLREGSAVHDFFHPDRIVIGADDTHAAARLTELYRPLVDRQVPVLVTSTVNAELIKYAANALLALKIGFINDIADLCENVDGDVSAIASGIGLDRRIGPHFLMPGPGYGGSCFPKDTEAFAATGRRHGAPQPLIETLIRQNEARKRTIASRILAEVKKRSGARIALLGVAFKADTDDVREAAALSIVPVLQKAGAVVSAYDPKAAANAARRLPGVLWFDTPYDACRDADVTVVLTEWEHFRSLDLGRLWRLMRGKTVFDCRNILDGKAVVEHGLRYVSIGRAAMPRTTPSAGAQRRDKRAEAGAAESRPLSNRA